MMDEGRNMEFCDVCKQKVNCMDNFHYTRKEVNKFSSHNMISYYLGLLFQKKEKIKICSSCTSLFKISKNSEYHIISIAKKFLEKSTKGL